MVRDANIVIVDDLEENLKVLTSTLMREGYHVRPARSGRMALESVFQRSPDLVLLDIRMPEMDGFSVCRQLKANPQTADIPVIFISAVEALSDKIKAFEAGGVDYITKPFHEKEILSRVKTHLTLHTLYQDLEAVVRQRTGELEKTNRALRMVNHSNRLLVHSQSEDTLQQAFCDSLLRIGGYPFCWVGCPRPQDVGGCEPTAMAPSGSKRLSRLVRLDGDSPDGPSARALETAMEVRINDIGRGRADVGTWQAQARKCGFHACLAMPFSSTSKTCGVLTVYATHSDFFDDAEADLIKELASNLALGMHMMRERNRRKKAETALMDREKQLLQAQKMEALGTLASGIAHDFNNIIYPIIGYSEVALTHCPPDSSNHRRISEILGCAKRANELVSQIMAFSRKSKPELRTLLLPPIIEDVVEPFRAFLPSTITLQMQIDGTCGFVRADPSHIHQIVINLITNAAHAMEDTGGHLEITLCPETLGQSDLLHKEMQPGDYVCVGVSDNGTGIDPTTMDKLFDPYFTTKEKGKGTGLGLAVVHGIVTGYGGGIRVESTPGKGARFEVYLPVSQQQGGRDVLPVPATEIPHGREKIMVVDDKSRSVDMLQESLGLLGYRVTCYDNGESALEAFRTTPGHFDLVLTDYAMPAMNGAQLAEALLAIRPDIPIILCSGCSEPFTDERTAAIGIRRFVKKPLFLDQLARIVRDALDSPAP